MIMELNALQIHNAIWSQYPIITITKLWILIGTVKFQSLRNNWQNSQRESNIFVFKGSQGCIFLEMITNHSNDKD